MEIKIPICHLCGERIELTDDCAEYFGSKVHLGCLHDITCPDEENERL